MSSISLYELLSEFAYRGDCYVDNSLRKLHNSSLHGSFIQRPNSITVLLFNQNIFKFLTTVWNIPKFKDRVNWSRDTFQPMRRRTCVYQQTNQNIAPVIKNFQKRTESDRIKDELTVLV